MEAVNPAGRAEVIGSLLSPRVLKDTIALHLRGGGLAQLTCVAAAPIVRRGPIALPEYEPRATMPARPW